MFPSVLALLFISATAMTVAGTAAKGSSPFGDAVVIMSKGRGGSSWFAEVIKRTFPKNGDLSIEVLGSSEFEMAKVKNPVAKVEKYLTQQRKENPQGLVGFKWKPYINNEAYDDLYKFVAENRIPVLLLSRNPLDRELSFDKHHENDVAAHCTKSDPKCVEKHNSIKIHVPTEHLAAKLHTAAVALGDLLAKMDGLGVKYLHVSYDQLAYGCDDEKLKIIADILRFLYPDHDDMKPSLKPLNTKYVATSDRNQSNVVSNYAEVVAALKGTPHEVFLRQADPPCPK